MTDEEVFDAMLAGKFRADGKTKVTFESMTWERCFVIPMLIH